MVTLNEVPFRDQSLVGCTMIETKDLPFPFAFVTLNEIRLASACSAGVVGVLNERLKVKDPHWLFKLPEYPFF